MSNIHFSSGTPPPSQAPTPTTAPSLSNTGKNNVFQNFDNDDDYPDCNVPIEHRHRIGDGICDDHVFDAANTNEWNWDWNVPFCGFDGGDCIPEVDLERDYPDCIPQLIKLGYGSERIICNGDDLGIDGESGSAGSAESACYVRNGRCDESVFAIEACGYEFGECQELEREYAGCNVPPKWIGDGTCQTPANTRECQWDGGDCDSSSDNSSGNGNRRAIIDLCIVLGIVGMSLLCLIFHINRLFKRYARSREWQEQLGQLPPISLQQEVDEKQDLEARKRLILERILQRKIVSLHDTNPETFEVNPTNGSDHNGESLVAVLAAIPCDEDDTTFSKCSIRSFTSSHESCSTLDIDEEACDGGSRNEDGNKDEPATESNKPNFNFVPTTSTSTCTALRKDMTDNPPRTLCGTKEDTTTSTTITMPTISMSLPTTCPICVEDYVNGDIIAWSHNAKCAHAFHRDCVVQWLMNHDECPMCRSAYLVGCDETTRTLEEEECV